MNHNAEKQLAVIVEDNLVLANMFSRALADVGYNTLVIDDGQKALDWLLENSPYIVFLDMHLPSLSGREILEQISAHPKFSETYLVIITADARMGEMLARKASFLLTKPVDIPELQQLAKRLLTRKFIKTR